ncbi:hypothetical protein [Halogeometricum limi]|uniref:Uncharacterized protein n=1 Tax=Halogeometricum limi TaxID=555875 RepID=A0A1I6GMH6_9EURY|nr:hypothetical protein [Halogeometricum limi]SFR43341.1 hypothetical protein SAMN04488124_1264 [Halogeometricum limi]
MVVFTVGVGGAKSHPNSHAVRDHYLLGVVGLVVAALAMFAAYSLLVSVANLVPLLSTTFLAFVGIVLWVFVWMALDVVYGRYTGDRYVE